MAYEVVFPSERIERIFRKTLEKVPVHDGSSVCADGGNPDPTSTHGKTPEEAKALELQGWHYPWHLAGRLFPIIVHGDTQGADVLCHSLTDWLLDMEIIQSNHAYMLDRHIG